jgi:hypothetical protein
MHSSCVVALGLPSRTISSSTAGEPTHIGQLRCPRKIRAWTLSDQHGQHQHMLRLTSPPDLPLLLVSSFSTTLDYGSGTSCNCLGRHCNMHLISLQHHVCRASCNRDMSRQLHAQVHLSSYSIRKVHAHCAGGVSQQARSRLCSLPMHQPWLQNSQLLQCCRST